MKKIIIYLYIACFCALSFCGCEKASLVTYDQDANIYFDLSQSNRDSIVYTFAYDMTKALDTLLIPVRIMGNRVAKMRDFEAYVERDSSTAVADLHYKTLSSAYSLEASQGRGSLPLIIYNVPDLEEKSVSLILKLKESVDFGIDNPRLIRARIVLSARLEKPNWWDMWLTNYSRVKHQLFMIVTEQTSLSMIGLEAPKNLYFANLLTMMLNDPFKWVANNPQKGYVLTTDDNGATYAFYHKENPARTMVLKKNEGAGRYYFIDELGKEVR
ncbi:DUF4843 domain-containing protein [Sphingobacterium sp. LRF_L2]|uniref:DUF4843 domain-containing protein n=1 Tax=Sphingobacterium sp. LRF_L2 TaxID=3369421 RepID=UPI003F640AAD